MKTLYSSSFPTWEQFEEFDELIRSIGFIKINKYKNPNKETGYYFPWEIDGKLRKAIVWTTAVEYDKTFKDPGKDAGRVLIVDVTDEKAKTEVVKYTARYFARRGNFFFRLFKYAEIAKERIINPPYCPDDDCMEPMDIYRMGKRQYMWICENTRKHLEPVFEEFDVNLEAWSKKFLKIRRKQVANRNKRQKKE